MKYQAVIFDLDGVICPTDKFHYMAWKAIAEELDIPFSRTINDRMRGIGRMASLEVLLEGSHKKYTEEMKEAYAAKKNELYRGLLKTLSPKDLDPDVIETLRGVKDTGLKAAIGSSSKNTRLILSRLGLDNSFDAISDGTNISHSKPDPEVFLKAAEYLKVDTPKCLVVEDAESGLEAAKAAGMDSAAIGIGTSCGLADYNLKKLSDLLRII